MPDQIGIGIVWGIATSAVSSGSVIVTGEDYKREADKVEIKNSLGDIAAVYYHNRRTSLSVKCFPSGENAVDVVLPAIGDTITLTAASDAEIAGLWVVDSCGRARKSDGIMEFDMGLMRYSEISLD